MKPTFDATGTLLIPAWSFSTRDPRVPHRHIVIASGKAANGDEIFVCRNHRSFKALFWLHALGSGFAGPHSRASNTFTTRNAELAERWVEAVKAGKIKMRL